MPDPNDATSPVTEPDAEPATDTTDDEAAGENDDTDE